MTVTVREPSKTKRLTLLGVNNVSELLDAEMFSNMSIQFKNDSTKWYTWNGGSGIHRNEIKKQIESMSLDQLRFDAVDSILVDNDLQTCCIVMKA